MHGVLSCYDRIVITGTMAEDNTAFFADIAETILDSVSTDHPTDGQLVALARQ